MHERDSMKTIGVEWRLWAAAALVSLSLSRAVFGQGLPAEVVGPRPAARVVDTTGRLTADEQREIGALLDGIRAQTRGDMMVVLIPSTLGAPHRSFATELFNRWRLGTAERNDGLLLFAALDDRRAEIILGTGLDDASRRAASQRVMDGVMIPEFKAGRPGDAIRRGAFACADEILGSRTESAATPDPAAIRGADRPADRPADAMIDTANDAAIDAGADPSADRPADADPPPPPPWPRPGDVAAPPPGRPWGPLAALAGGVAATGAGGYGLWHLAVRRRRRTCRRCHVAMIKLDEQLDDGRIDPSERTEETVGSVDYDVWTCPRCPLVEKLRYPAFFTRYARCPDCRAVTELTTASRLRAPTRSSEGVEEVTESCGHCGRQVQFHRSIPRLVEKTSSGMHWSSGSSGSSRSSGGRSPSGGSGGRSSGGGASGGW